MSKAANPHAPSGFDPVDPKWAVDAAKYPPDKESGWTYVLEKDGWNHAHDSIRAEVQGFKVGTPTRSRSRGLAEALEAAKARHASLEQWEVGCVAKWWAAHLAHLKVPCLPRCVPSPCPAALLPPCIPSRPAPSVRLLTPSPHLARTRRPKPGAHPAHHGNEDSKFNPYLGTRAKLPEKVGEPVWHLFGTRLAPVWHPCPQHGLEADHKVIEQCFAKLQAGVPILVVIMLSETHSCLPTWHPCSPFAADRLIGRKHQSALPGIVDGLSAEQEEGKRTVEPLLEAWHEYSDALLPHLREEEAVGIPLMRAYFTQDEINKLVGEILGSKTAPREEMGAFIHHLGHDRFEPRPLPVPCSLTAAFGRFRNEFMPQQSSPVLPTAQLRMHQFPMHSLFFRSQGIPFFVWWVGGFKAKAEYYATEVVSQLEALKSGVEPHVSKDY
eukprot:gene1632-2858_t